MNSDGPIPGRRGPRQDTLLEDSHKQAPSDTQGMRASSLEPGTTETQATGPQVNDSDVLPPASTQVVPGNLVEDERVPGLSTQRSVSDDSYHLSDNETALQVLLAEALYMPTLDDDRESTTEEDAFLTAEEAQRPTLTPKSVHKAWVNLSERSDIDDSGQRVSFGTVSFSDGGFKDKKSLGRVKQSLLRSVSRKRNQNYSTSLTTEHESSVEATDTGRLGREEREEALQKPAADPISSGASEKQNKLTSSASAEQAANEGATLPEQDSESRHLSNQEEGESSERGKRRTSDIMPEAPGFGQHAPSTSVDNKPANSTQPETSSWKALRVDADVKIKNVVDTQNRRPLKQGKIFLDDDDSSNKKIATANYLDALDEVENIQTPSDTPPVTSKGYPEIVSHVSADENTYVISEDRTEEKSSYARRLVSSFSGFLYNSTAMAVSRKFLMLIIFCSCSMINAFQWIEYAIISNIVSKYYGVSEATVAWTSLLYLLGYIMLAFPSAWVLDTLGLRVTVIIGATGTCIGACIKVMSVEPGRFALVLVGQSFPAFAQAFILGVPPRLASAWFRYEEISTACSTAVIGNQLGIALGFVIPPYLIDEANVKSSLLVMCFGVAVVSFLCSSLAIVAFQDKPENLPSFAEMVKRDSTNEVGFVQGLCRLLAIAEFSFLLLSYGIITGTFYALSTLLNPVVLECFPGEKNFAGWIGLVLIVSGLVGSWMCGVLLDKTGEFKQVTFFVYALSTVGVLAYTFVFALRSRFLVVLVCFFLGFFMTGYIPIGLQVGSEITYPLPEGLTANMLNMSAQGMGFLLILVSAHIREQIGDRAANFSMSVLMIIGCGVTMMLKMQPKRREALRRQRRKKSYAKSSAATDQRELSSGQK